MPEVLLSTTKGDIRVRLDADKAPISTANFLQYVRSGHYDGTVFHRVIPNFMIQGGGMTQDLRPKPTKAQIKNEAGNGLKNRRGTLAMARTSVVDSATSQFFINVKDNDFLDHKDETSSGFGYAVFGEVVDGMDVVDLIVSVRTGNQGGHQNVPLDPVILTSATECDPAG
jgi:cyclophilin family peptidyl-prolyl cis-trans isomerase